MPSPRELQHVAARVAHGLDHRLEIAVERGEQVGFAEPFAHRGEAAQVGQQDRRFDMAVVAAPDGAREHRIGGAVAEEGAQQAGARAAHGGGLERGGQRVAQALDQLEVPVGEAARAVAHQTQPLHGAIAILERQRQVVGAARGGHLVQHLVVAPLVQIDQPAPEGPPVLDHVLERAAEVRAGRKHGPRHQVLVRARAVAGPDHAPGAGQRIGKPLPGAQPPERHAAFDEPAAEAVDQVERHGGHASLADQPPRDPVGRLLYAVRLLYGHVRLPG